MSAEREGDVQVIPDAIRGLLEQRARYHDWLEKLDDVGGKYRPEVADRVRGDYRARLSSVEKELHGHRSELEASLEEHRARLDDLRRRHDEHAAGLEEAELRFQVGEFEQSEWDGRRGEAERALSEIGAELETERAAVGELAGVLAEVAGEGERAAVRQVEPGAWSGSAATAAPADPDVAGEPEAPAGPESAAEEGRAAEAIEVELVEDEALDAEVVEAGVADEEVVEAEVVEAEVVEEKSGDAAGTAGAAPADSEEDFLDELEFLESLSLDDPESFDAVSRMLEEEGGDESDRGGAG